MFLLLLYRLDLPLVDFIDEITVFEAILPIVCYSLKSVVGRAMRDCHKQSARSGIYQQFEVNCSH